MGSPKTPEAPKADYGADISSFVGGLKQSMPTVLGLEGKYRDNFGRLNLNDVSSFLNGGNGTKGIAALGGALSKRAGKQLAAAQAREINQMTRQTGDVRGMLRKLSPESAKMVRMATQDAFAAQRSAQGLTGQENRSAQQFAREASADRGRVMDNSSIASELLNRDSILGAKRQEAATLTNNAYNMANSFYSTPGLIALSGTPNSYTAGNNYLGMGLGAIGSAKPQLVDVGAGLNLGAANRQNLFAANAVSAGKPSMGATVGAGALSGAMAGGSVAGPYGAIAGGLIGGAGGYFSGR